MKKFFTLIAVALMAFAAQANELTVCDNGVVGEDAYGAVPVYGWWYDTDGYSQMIYPAEMLTDMAGGKITELKFYTAATWGEDYSDYTIAFSGGQIQLALKEVEETGFDENNIVTITGATVVSTIVPETGGLYLTFVLDEPFQYNGGNLLVETTVTEPGTYGRTYFCGEEVGYNCTYYGFDYYGDWTEYAIDVLSMITFTYEAAVTPVDPPVDPTEMTGSPTFNGYTEDGIYAYFVEIIETEPSTIYYKIFIWDDEAGDWVAYGEEDWTEYTEILSFNSAGKYRIEAYAIAPDKLPSNEIAYEFVLSKITGVLEVVDGKQVANVRYFNMAGQEVQEANGLTIKVTTYTDGTTDAVKIVK